MGNSAQKKTNSLLDTENASIDKDYSDPLNTARDRGNWAYNDAQSQIPGLRNRFENLADTGGFNSGDWSQFDSAYNSDTGGGGGGTLGPFDESRWADAISGYNEFAGRTGGVDAEGIRTRANRAIPQFYQNLKDESTRRRMVNPYGPSFDAEQAKMARQSGQQTQENIRDTETSISDMISKNRMGAIGGLANLQTNIAGLKSNQDIANAQLNESAAGRRDAATGRRESLALQKQGMIQSGKLSGLSGLSGMFDTQNSNAKDYFNSGLSGLASKHNAKIGALGARSNKGVDWAKWAAAAATAAAMI